MGSAHFFISFFFFFQAEDGIRDIGVTGVQTCALPIYTLRRRREIVEFNPETHAGAGGGPEADALRAELSRSVQDAVATLPQNYGVPLIPRYSEGPSYAQIAEGLDINIPAVMNPPFPPPTIIA